VPCFIGIIVGVIIGPFIGYSAIDFLRLISIPVAGLVLSALLAALVAFEEGYRQRTKQLLGQEREPT
jgi:purine-cytosine permease-like protein